jgi:hypothetical protein
MSGQGWAASGQGWAACPRSVPIRIFSSFKQKMLLLYYRDRILCMEPFTVFREIITVKPFAGRTIHTPDRNLSARRGGRPESMIFFMVVPTS